jgi:TolB-like protein/Tfp pilus assembly protein PilF
MPHTPGKFRLFWREVKRRKVFRSLAIYAGTAFIILEASTIIFPRWGLPDWTIDLVLYLLILGAFVNVIIAWFYDITPEGLQKTRSLKEVPGDQRAPDSRTWKAATYISLLIIVVLVLLNVIGGTKELKAGDIQSLVILPFENYTGDDQLENLVAGMHSMLIGDMGRVSGLRVIGKTSSRQYENADMSARDIAADLNVDAVVEATVMCMGDSVCMQFRLVSTKGDEEQLWVGEYHEDKGQILNMYNRVTKQIAREVHIELTASEKEILAKDRAADRDAIEAYILSYTYWGDLSAEAFDKAEEFLLLALEKDPEWAPIHAALAIVWAGRMQMGDVDTETGRIKISEYIKRARELDDDFPDSHFINGVLFLWPDWQWEKGEIELLQAIEINPNHVMARIYYAHLLMSLQRMDEALEQGKFALDLDPKNPLILSLYAVVLKGAERHHEVLEYLEEALAIDPDHDFTKGQLERALYNSGDYERSLELNAAYLSRRLAPEDIPDLVYIYREKGRQAAYEEVARLWEAFYEDFDPFPLSMSRHYYRAGEFTKALDVLESGYRVHNPNMPYIGTGSRYEALHDSTRFLAILDSMKLPHPKKP